MEDTKAWSLHVVRLPALPAIRLCIWKASCFRLLNLKKQFVSHSVALLKYRTTTLSGADPSPVRMHDDGNSKQA